MSASDRAILVADGDPRLELARRGVAPQPTVGAFPLPVREPTALRALHVEVALAGADVLTAVTGSLHRRTLSRMGAARRGREWIAAAVDLAREAAAEAEDAGRPARDGVPAPPVRVAGLVGPLEGSGASGLSLDLVAAAAEHRAHAGMLADAGAQLLRIEAMESIAESEAATREALATGLETWTGVAVEGSGLALPSGESLEAWAAVIGPLGPDVLLVTAPTLEATCAALGALEALGLLGAGGPAALGGSLPTVPADGPAVPDAARLLEAGCLVLGAGRDGSPERVALLRAEADRHNARLLQGRHELLERRRAWVAQVADRARPGPALWVAPAAPEFPLPGSFAWDVVGAPDLGRLPAGRYRIAVAPTGAAGSASEPASPLSVEQLRRLVTTLEPGAWILVEGDQAADVLASDERAGGLLIAEPLPSGPPCWMVRVRP